MQSALSAPAPRRLLVLCANTDPDSTAGRELSENRHCPGAAGAYKVVKDAIGDLLIEGRAVSKAGQIEFERLCLDALLISYVFDVESRKVWLAGNRTERCKVVRIEFNHVVAMWIAILECFKRGRRNAGGEARLGAAKQTELGVR